MEYNSSGWIGENVCLLKKKLNVCIWEIMISWTFGLYHYNHLTSCRVIFVFNYLLYGKGTEI